MTQAPVIKQVNYAARRVTYYWLSLVSSYGFPIAYFGVKLGFTKESTSIVMPLIMMIGLVAIRIGMDIPIWIRSWRPSFMKGMLRAIPILILFIVLITLGLTLKYMLDNQVTLSFVPYFETVLVVFGSMSVGSIINALHLKNKELDMIAKGYVLGTINN
jgi:hypothetical protein